MLIPFPARGKSSQPRSLKTSRQDAFAELVRPHLGALYRLAYRFTRQQHEAEDLLQELLTRLYARPEGLGGIERLRPWLARALYNLFIDERRHLARSVHGHLQPAAPGTTEERSELAARQDPHTDLNFSAEMARLSQHLVDLVERLPREQREVVVLHDVEGYELHETAEILGLALGTVKSRLHRAHERLRGWLRERNLSPAAVVLANEGHAAATHLSLAPGSDHEL